MTISVRFDDAMAQAIEQAARAQGIAKSELLRRCVARYLSQLDDGRLAWQLGKDLFGRFDSGRTDLSSHAKSIVREKIHGQKGND